MHGDTYEPRVYAKVVFAKQPGSTGQVKIPKRLLKHQNCSVTTLKTQKPPVLSCTTFCFSHFRISILLEKQCKNLGDSITRSPMWAFGGLVPYSMVSRWCFGGSLAPPPYSLSTSSVLSAPLPVIPFEEKQHVNQPPGFFIGPKL